MKYLEGPGNVLRRAMAVGSGHPGTDQQPDHHTEPAQLLRPRCPPAATPDPPLQRRPQHPARRGRRRSPGYLASRQGLSARTSKGPRGCRMIPTAASRTVRLRRTPNAPRSGASRRAALPARQPSAGPAPRSAVGDLTRRLGDRRPLQRQGLPEARPPMLALDGSGQSNRPRILPSGNLPDPGRRGTVPRTQRGHTPARLVRCRRSVVCHQCDSHGCTNPGHLRLGTNTENRAEWAARHRNPTGPLADVRGAAGRTRAIAEAILAGLTRGESTQMIEQRIARLRRGIPRLGVDRSEACGSWCTYWRIRWRSRTLRRG